MLTKKEITEVLILEFPKLVCEFNLKKIGLFGSYVQNSATDDSDIDFVVEFSEPVGLKFITFCDYLENLFHKKVDVLTFEGLKNIRIKSIMENILETVEYVNAA